MAVEKSGLPKSKVSIKEFGVDEDGKGLCDEAGLACMVCDCAQRGFRIQLLDD